jgi:hypothetical protein
VIIAPKREPIQVIGLENKQKSRIFEGCRSNMIKNDTAVAHCPEGNRIPWEREDCIRWVKWRIRELTIENGKYVDERGRWLLEEKAANGRKFTPGDKVADYAVWLLKVRDNLSWHQIAYRFYPSATEQDVEKYELRVRRICDRVQREHPGSKAFKAPRLSRDDRLLLQAVASGVIPVYVSAAPAVEISKGMPGFNADPDVKLRSDSISSTFSTVSTVSRKRGK